MVLVLYVLLDHLGFGRTRSPSPQKACIDHKLWEASWALARLGKKAFWDPYGLLALPWPVCDFEGLLSLGFRPPFVELAAGLDGGHGAGPPRPTQQLFQVLPLHAPIRPNPSPFPCF
jgi:hypothetical protein